MASTASASPHPYDFTSDEETWAFLEQASSSPNPGSVGFLPSPMSGSMGSYGIIGYPNQAHFPSPPAPSPLQLDAFELPPPFPQHAFQDDQTSSLALEGSGTTAVLEETQFLSTAGMAGDSELANLSSLLGPDFQLNQQQLQELALANLFSGTQPMMQFDLTQRFQPAAQLDIPQQLQSTPNEEPWNPTTLKTNQTGTMFIMEGFSSSPSPSAQSHISPVISAQSHISPTISPRVSESPRSPGIKQEPGSHKNSAPITIRRVQGPGVRVQKKKGTSSESSSLNSNGSTFMIVTPDSISAQAGKPNQYDCFDVSRTSHKGRKGPLGDATKENALQVRRVGACFCCHARKVKCDAERPCKNCKKMMNSVPQLVCWQFHDFLTILFPGFLREHFRKDDMAQFFSDHIESFTVGGVEKTCTVELFSGPRFAKTLLITAKLFTAKTSEVLRHWHLNPDDKENFDLREQQSAPLGLDLNGAQRDEVKKKAKAYIDAMTHDTAYVEQVTDAMTTPLPRRMLQLATQYCRQTDSQIVRKALAIFAMQYFMSRHLCMTPTTVAELVSTKAIPSGAAFTTARVLNRQIKAIVDEMLQKEMQALFDAFSRSLKPKMRKEWAPCTAAFLVLCLFMEQVETAADTFAITQRQEAYLKGLPLKGVIKRATALALNREIEAMPYRQFAHQFHQIYQTHSRDATTRAFNPIFDESLIQSGDLDDAGAQLARGLRELLEGESFYELDFLVADPMFPNNEDHPFPCNITHNYLGRLSSMFLLSFRSDAYIFGPKT